MSFVSLWFVLVLRRRTVGFVDASRPAPIRDRGCRSRAARRVTLERRCGRHGPWCRKGRRRAVSGGHHSDQIHGPVRSGVGCRRLYSSTRILTFRNDTAAPWSCSPICPLAVSANPLLFLHLLVAMRLFQSSLPILYE